MQNKGDTNVHPVNSEKLLYCYALMAVTTADTLDVDKLIIERPEGKDKGNGKGKGT